MFRVLRKFQPGCVAEHRFKRGQQEWLKCDYPAGRSRKIGWITQGSLIQTDGKHACWGEINTGGSTELPSCGILWPGRTCLNHDYFPCQLLRALEALAVWLSSAPSNQLTDNSVGFPSNQSSPCKSAHSLEWEKSTYRRHPQNESLPKPMDQLSWSIRSGTMSSLKG